MFSYSQYISFDTMVGSFLGPLGAIVMDAISQIIDLRGTVTVDIYMDNHYMGIFLNVFGQLYFFPELQSKYRSSSTTQIPFPP